MSSSLVRKLKVFASKDHVVMDLKGLPWWWVGYSSCGLTSWANLTSSNQRCSWGGRWCGRHQFLSHHLLPLVIISFHSNERDRNYPCECEWFVTAIVLEWWAREKLEGSEWVVVSKGGGWRTCGESGSLLELKDKKVMRRGWGCWSWKPVDGG